MTAGVVPLSGLIAIPVAQLVADPNNPRGPLGDTSALEESIKRHGVLEPLTVRETATGRYEVIEGHRRRQAAGNIGLEYVPAIIRKPLDAPHQLLTQLTIDAHRKPFGPMAEAEACYRLFNEYKMGRAAIAVQTGRSPAWVRDRLALIRLSPEDQGRLRRGNLTIGEALLRVAADRITRGEAAPPRERLYRKAPRKTTAPKAGREPAQGGDTGGVHFGPFHPLADQVGKRCNHTTYPRLGGVACGGCWEAVIREDATARSAT